MRLSIALSALLLAATAAAEPGVLRVADATSWPGYLAAMQATYGGLFPDTSIRFDPADSFDLDGSLPRPFVVQRIHFLVEAGQGTGPLRVQVHETNGGEKPDEARILFDTSVTAGPGENVVDLVALGTPVTIDPPRMFHVTFRGQGSGGAPFVAADDGLPYVGGAGDFHTGVRYTDANCNVPTFGFAPPNDAAGDHSSNLMVWLDVDFTAPPAAPKFVRSTALPGCSRCAWGDFDGDGDPDALSSGNQLFRNDGGGAFTDVTAQAFPTARRWCGGGLWADFDDDGDLDFLCQTADCWRCPTNNPVPQGAKNYDSPFRNEGDTNGDGVPEFTDLRTIVYGGSDSAPLPGDPDPTEGAAVGDWNGDGYLDVYLANHNDWTTYDAFRDHLYVNDGPPDFTFTDASTSSGVDSVLLHGRGVAPADYDGDGDTDIFVTNYVLDPDLLWENRGVDERDLPRFVNVAAARGVQGTLRSGAYGHGIGAAWGDANGDARLDLLVGNLAHSAWLCFSDTTKLFIASAATPPTFTDVRPASGIGYCEVHSDASFADFDNDGDQDVLITHVYDGWRTSVYENLGTDPPTFRDVFAEAGIGQRSAWGSAWADFDGDGDLDLWDAGGLYVNQAAGQPNTHWLELRLLATRSNPQSIGATVTVEVGGRTLVTQVFGARGTSSQDDFTRHFGLGAATSADRVFVRWPSGCTAELLAVPADQRVDVAEPQCLMPAFHVQTASSGLDPRRPARVACVGETVRFFDDTAGTVRTRQWDLDGDAIPDSILRQPTFVYPIPGLIPVTLTVDDGSGQRSITKPIRIDAAPPAPANLVAAQVNPCLSDVQLTWDPVGFGRDGPGVYNVYRGTDAADAVSRPPIVSGLTDATFLDETTFPAIPYVYVVEAEDAHSPGGCSPGPHHWGCTSRTELAAPISDQAQVPHFGVAAAADADPCALSGNLVTWQPAEFLDPTGTGVYNVYRAEGRCPDPTATSGDPAVVTGLTGTSWIDASAVPGVAYTYLVQAEDARRSTFCRRGPHNGGATTSVCVTAPVTDTEEHGSADPGAVLRVTKSGADALLDWSATTAVPLAGEAWGARVANAPAGPWSLLPPGRLSTTTATDPALPGAPLRCYLATILSPGGCPAP